MKRSAAVLGVFFLVALPMPASMAVELFQSAQGDWRGRGDYARTGSSQSEERLTCRLNATLRAPETLQLRGRCATAAQSRSFGATLVAGGGGAVSGSVNVAMTRGETVGINGRIDGNLMTLRGSSRGTDYEMQVQRVEAGLSMVIRSQSAGGAETIRVHFPAR